MIKNLIAIKKLKIMSRLFSVALVTIMSNTMAQAELTDRATVEPSEHVSSNASWAIKPNFVASPRFFECVYDEEGKLVKPCPKKYEMTFLLQVNKEGYVESVQISKSSGESMIDRRFARDIKRARFKPFMKEGQAIAGLVTLPITFAMPPS